VKLVHLSPDQRTRIQKEFEASDDGKAYRTVFDIPSAELPQSTFTFAPVTAKYFRVTFKTPEPPRRESNLSALFGGLMSQRPAAEAGIRVAEIVLYTAARVNRFEDKAGFTATPGLYALATPEIPVPML